MTINELKTSQDMQVFQRDIAFDKLSSVIAERARRNVMVDDASRSKHTIEKTLQQTANTFVRNVEKICKIDVTNEKIKQRVTSTVIEPENAEQPQQEDHRIESPSKILKGEDFIKMKQRENIVTDYKNSIFLSPNAPVILDITTHKLHHKSLCLDEPETSSDDLESSMGTLSSKTESSENIGVLNMQMEIPSMDAFTPQEAAAIAYVLEECLDQLAIIGFIIPAKVDPRWDDTFKTIDEMYGVPDEPRTIFREEMSMLPIVPTETEKMQRDRNYVYGLLKRILHDVRVNGRFKSLQEEINNIAKKQEDERNLEASTQIWVSQAEQLRELLESDKKANEEDRERTITAMQESDSGVDHAIFLNSGKLGYAERWAKARLEQQELKLYLEKRDLLNKLSDYSKDYNEEQIVSAELSNYLEADIKEKEEQITIWTKKYNDEIEERQQEIDELKKLIKEQKLEIEQMQVLKDKRQEFIDEYMAEEKRLQEEAKHREKLDKAATIIQSIWKSYMVRHQLGKYKNLRKRLLRRKLKAKRKRAQMEKR